MQGVAATFEPGEDRVTQKRDGALASLKPNDIVTETNQVGKAQDACVSHRTKQSVILSRYRGGSVSSCHDVCKYGEKCNLKERNKRNPSMLQKYREESCNGKNIRKGPAFFTTIKGKVDSLKSLPVSDIQMRNETLPRKRIDPKPSKNPTSRDGITLSSRHGNGSKVNHSVLSLNAKRIRGTNCQVNELSNFGKNSSVRSVRRVKSQIQSLVEGKTKKLISKASFSLSVKSCPPRVQCTDSGLYKKREALHLKGPKKAGALKNEGNMCLVTNDLKTGLKNSSEVSQAALSSSASPKNKNLGVMQIGTLIKQPSSKRLLVPSIPHGTTDIEGQGVPTGRDTQVKVLRVATSEDNRHRTIRAEKASLEANSPVKLKFQIGKVVDLQDQKSSLWKFVLRRRRLSSEPQRVLEVDWRSILKKSEIVDDMTKVMCSGEKIVLRHQEAIEHRANQNLLNSVIKVTASKLAETRKSKVKALVGAFETVISLQNDQPSACLSSNRTKKGLSCLSF